MASHHSKFVVHEDMNCVMNLKVHLRDSTGNVNTIELRHDKNQQSDCAPSKHSDQPGHPHSLIRVFAVRLMGS